MMLCLQPREVAWNGATLPDVSVVAVDRNGRRIVREWDDGGPHARFVDVADIEVTVRVVQQLWRGDLGGPVIGSAGELTFRTAPTAGDVGTRRYVVSGVVTSVTHDVSHSSGARAGGSARREITIVGVSGDGVADPMVIAEGGGVK
jgi:hypothetical protein